ncbi:MAG: 50S ribosomal protein L17 [Alphaproteobacteria bacterium]|nr:50S ribosomal protein L17 [Alphaproteobacteria bacterium]
MRHGDKIKNLSRTKEHRAALLRNLGSALITKKRIVTTLAKAKALRIFIEPLITKTKKSTDTMSTMHQHRVVFSFLHDKIAVKELFNIVAPKVANRNGGYTRIIKLGRRLGDNAELAMIELVDFNDIYLNKAQTTVKSTTRRGRKKSKTTSQVDEAQIAETVENKNTTEPQTTTDTEVGV